MKSRRLELKENGLYGKCPSQFWLIFCMGGYDALNGPSEAKFIQNNRDQQSFFLSEGRIQHMLVIYMRLSMLIGQTRLTPNQSTGPKVKNLPDFDIFQPIWLKHGIKSLNGGTQCMYTIISVKPAYQPGPYGKGPPGSPWRPLVGTHTPERKRERERESERERERERMNFFY